MEKKPWKTRGWRGIVLAVNQLWREDRAVAFWFTLLIPAAILTWVAIYYVSPRVFNGNKSVGIALPLISSMVSIPLGMVMVHASLHRQAQDLKLLGGWPNLAVFIFYLLGAHVLDVWTSQHRTDRGHATGILDDTQQAYFFATLGACLGAVAHGGLMCHCARRAQYLQHPPQNPTSTNVSWFHIAAWGGALVTCCILLGYRGTSDNLLAADQKLAVLKRIHNHHIQTFEAHRIIPEEGKLLTGAHVALVITGDVFDFDFGTTISQVVEGNSKAGFAMHVFALLSRNTASSWTHSNKGDPEPLPAVDSAGEKKMEVEFRKQVAVAGGIVKLFKIVDQFPIKEVEFAETAQFHHKFKSSTDLLMQYHAINMAWQYVKAAEIKMLKMYDAVIQQRNDAYWFQPLKLEAFPKHQVSIKSCLGSLNNDFAVVPRTFAGTWFEILYDYYLTADALASQNPQKFVSNMMMSKQVPFWEADSKIIGTTHFRHHQKGGCFLEEYLGVDMACVPEAYREFTRSRACGAS